MRFRRLIGLAVILSMSLGLVGCAKANQLEDARLPAGSTFTTQSGLTFSVPAGAAATVTRPGTTDAGATYSEMVAVTIRDSITVRFISWRDGGRNALPASAVASASAGEVVVLGDYSPGIGAVVDVSLAGHAQGRVFIGLPADSAEARRGIGLAETVWRELDVRGVALP